MLSYADLYVHTADVEIEAISCLKALPCGLVPVISDSVQSATSQFALDEQSTFSAGNEIDLVEKIDYWYENNQEKLGMGIKYAKSAEKYSLNNSANMLNEISS